MLEEAVEAAGENARMNGVSNARFVCSDAVKADLDSFDAVIVDPPRKGLSPELTDKLISSEIKRLVYVSCNPETLARDAKKLLGRGFSISSVRPFDMFPRTGSVECVTDFYR